MEDSRLKSCYCWPKVTKFRIDFNGTEVVRGQRRRTSKNWPEYLNPLGMFLSRARSSRVSCFRQSRTKHSISIIKVAQKVGTKEDLWGDTGKKLWAGKELSRDKIKKASSEYTREARIRPLKRSVFQVHCHSIVQSSFAESTFIFNHLRTWKFKVLFITFARIPRRQVNCFGIWKSWQQTSPLGSLGQVVRMKVFPSACLWRDSALGKSKLTEA